MHLILMRLEPLLFQPSIMLSPLPFLKGAPPPSSVVLNMIILSLTPSREKFSGMNQPTRVHFRQQTKPSSPSRIQPVHRAIILESLLTFMAATLSSVFLKTILAILTVVRLESTSVMVPLGHLIKSSSQQSPLILSSGFKL